MSADIWSKAPEGATHYAPKIDDSGLWCDVYWRKDGDSFPEAWRVEDSGELSNVKNPTVIADSLARMIPRPDAWNGFGVPPNGTVCEVYEGDPPARWEEDKKYLIGQRVTVRASFVNDCDQNICAIELASNRCVCILSRLLRPVRTAEQIAAEERESHVLGMLCYDALGGTRRGLAEALYDAGYRKVEGGAA